MDNNQVLDFFTVPLGAAAEVAHEAILLIDGRRTVVAANPAALDMFACTRPQLIGSALERLLPQSLFGAQALDQAGRAAPGGMTTGTVRARRFDGHEFAAEASVSRLDHGLDDEPQQGYIVVLREAGVESRLRAEVELMTGRVGAVLDAMPAAMWVSEAGRIAFANRTSATLFGRERGADLVGRPVDELLGEPVHSALKARHADRVVASAASTVVTGTITRPDGSRREVEVASVELPDHGKSVLQMVISDITDRADELRQHQRRRDALRAYSHNAVQAREDERKRIARELHDELGQHLTALKMELSSLMSGPPPAQWHERLAGAVDLIDATVAAVRRIASDLRPLALDDLGLNAAIEGLAREAARRLGIEVTVSLGADHPGLSEQAAIALYRIVQEALTNIGRHARATDARIELRDSGGELVLTIRDNGIGFEPDALQLDGRFGLLGARERAAMLGGRLDIDNPPGGGGRITVRLPLSPAAALPGAGS